MNNNLSRKISVVVTNNRHSPTLQPLINRLSLVGCDFELMINSLLTSRNVLEKTSGDPVCFLDLRQEISVKNLRIALAYYDEYQADIVIGSRFHPKSNLQPSIKALLSSRLAQGMLKFLFNLHLGDPQIALGVFRREVLTNVLPELQLGSLLELLILAKKKGYKKIIEAPIISTKPLLESFGFQLAKETLLDAFSIFNQKVIAKTDNHVPQPHLIKL